MREIDFTSQFKKDFRREGKSRRVRDFQQVFELIIDLLVQDKTLPLRMRDHLLKGDYVGIRECHIAPDLLLLYFKSGENLLTLVRMGTHSELF
jgi:mRNA interferase YafQ